MEAYDEWRILDIGKFLPQEFHATFEWAYWAYKCKFRKADSPAPNQIRPVPNCVCENTELFLMKIKLELSDFCAQSHIQWFLPFCTHRSLILHPTFPYSRIQSHIEDFRSPLWHLTRILAPNNEDQPRSAAWGFICEDSDSEGRHQRRQEEF